MKTFIVQQFIVVDPSRRGHWYECRRVQAVSYSEALVKAFEESVVPKGYRLISV